MARMDVHQVSEVICPYCNKPALLVGGNVIYPSRPDLRAKKFWHCAPCDAYVGCHDRNKKFGFAGVEPLGRLANFVLRQHKMQAHAAFDPLWKDGGDRSAAYAWLAQALGIPRHECHIGMFDVAMCKKVVRVCHQSGRRFERRNKKTPSQRQLACFSSEPVGV